MKTIRDQIVCMKLENWEMFNPETGKIYSDVPNAIYHGMVDIASSSGLKTINKNTLQHFFDGQKATRSTSLGDDFHESIYSGIAGRDIKDLICVIPNYDKGSIEGCASFIVTHSEEPLNPVKLRNQSHKDLKTIAKGLELKMAAGRKIVTQSEFKRSQAMAQALREHPKVAKLFRMNGIPELSFYATIPVPVDGKTVQVKVKVRPDLLIELKSEIWIIDWKSIGKVATDQNIEEAMWTYRYDMSGGLYRSVISLFTGKKVRFFLVFAETKIPRPEKIVWMEIHDIDLSEGFEDCMKALLKLAHWRENKSWAGHEFGTAGFRRDIVMRKNKLQTMEVL